MDKIQEKTLNMANVLKIQSGPKDELLQTGAIEQLLASYDMYVNGPLVLQLTKTALNCYVPISEKLPAIDISPEITFVPMIKEECLYLRFLPDELVAETGLPSEAELNTKIESLLEHATKEGYEVTAAPYQILIPVFNEYMVEVYLPVSKVELF